MKVDKTHKLEVKYGDKKISVDWSDELHQLAKNNGLDLLQEFTRCIASEFSKQDILYGKRSKLNQVKSK